MSTHNICFRGEIRKKHPIGFFSKDMSIYVNLVLYFKFYVIQEIIYQNIFTDIVIADTVGKIFW